MAGAGRVVLWTHGEGCGEVHGLTFESLGEISMLRARTREGYVSIRGDPEVNFRAMEFGIIGGEGGMVRGSRVVGADLYLILNILEHILILVTGRKRRLPSRGSFRSGEVILFAVIVGRPRCRFPKQFLGVVVGEVGVVNIPRKSCLSECLAVQK